MLLGERVNLSYSILRQHLFTITWILVRTILFRSFGWCPTRNCFRWGPNWNPSSSGRFTTNQWCSDSHHVGFILFISCHNMGYHMTKWDCTSYDNSLLRGSVQSLGILLSTKIIVLGHHTIGPHGGRRGRLIGYGLTDRYLTSATSIPKRFNWSPRGC